MHDRVLELGPATATLTVRTGREGVAARAGHDLVLEPTRWNGSLVLGDERSELSVTVDAASFEVRQSTGGVKPLTEDDRAQIRRNIADKVLRIAQHPTITFASTAVERTSDQTVAVAGDLTIAGVSRPVQFDIAMARARLRAELSVLQSEFGIRPFSALMGTLKVADAVEISAEARLPAE